MKLYDTINGVFVSDYHIDVDLLKHEITSGIYTDYELDNLTLEGDNEYESISLRDFFEKVNKR